MAYHKRMDYQSEWNYTIVNRSNTYFSRLKMLAEFEFVLADFNLDIQLKSYFVDDILQYIL